MQCMFVNSEGPEARSIKTSIIFLILVFVKNCLEYAVYILFHYGWDPVLIQWIAIGFKAKLESTLLHSFIVLFSLMSHFIRHNKWKKELILKCSTLLTLIKTKYMYYNTFLTMNMSMHVKTVFARDLKG